MAANPDIQLFNHMYILKEDGVPCWQLVGAISKEEDPPEIIIYNGVKYELEEYMDREDVSGSYYKRMLDI